MQSKGIVKRARAYHRNAVKPDPAKPVRGFSIRAMLNDELAKRQPVTSATREELSCRVAAYVKVRHRYIWKTGLVLEEEQTSARETVRHYLDTIGNRYLRMSNTLLDKSDCEGAEAPAGLAEPLEAKLASHPMTDEEEDDELEAIISSDDEEPIEFHLQHLEERRKLDPELFH
ncbi:hypothetical protein HDV00_011582 [Rhizophlyctis rosea]|nr:hypothetical protein HDV00_011582 [Rhizophlyctis rosea]